MIQRQSCAYRAAQLGRSFLRRLERSLLGRSRGMTKPRLVLLILLPQVRSSRCLIFICCCWNRKRWIFWSCGGNRKTDRFIGATRREIGLCDRLILEKEVSSH